MLGWIIGIVIAAIVVILVIWLISAYNSLVILRKRGQNAWAQIDVQLNRRHDLIPNLVESAKGYMKYEQETLQKVIDARSKAVGAGNIKDKIDAENQLTGALGRLLAVFERYPDLKANQNVAMLMEQLTDTENKIAYARQFYNDIVTRYNMKTAVFPSNIVANLFKFEEMPLFKVEEEVKAVPKVDLNF
jgi:LemA protein|uniref:LemA family protein n=1 Tax=Mesoaciditoga lauensis TaxID=1495039 RepID=A0A7V3REE9_9BACT